MTVSSRITGFDAVGEPVTAPVTKFGGQPVWLTGPAWPLSRGWDGRPMRFVCQVALDGGRLAYVFLTHAAPDEPDFFDPDVIDPDGGENAVVVQPGGEFDGPVHARATGPSLFDETGAPVEFTVRLADSDERGLGFDDLSGNKIGGRPAFFQGEAWPEGGPWRLLLQLETDDLPFELNLGASPVAFAFVSQDLRRGRLLVQDS